MSDKGERYGMSRKTISLTGELHMNSTGFSVSVDALKTLKIVGIAYGVYDHAEDLRDCRVTLEDGKRPALVVQEDVSLHGSPFWETVRTITDDPERIQQYMAFRETLKMFQQIEREHETVQQDTGRSSHQDAPAKRKDCHER